MNPAAHLLLVLIGWALVAWGIPADGQRITATHVHQLLAGVAIIALVVGSAL